jgi:glycosyltransferase involved in cell wall biosynthesis
MKYSIITVCKNEESKIEKTIQSVVSQEFNDFEYIIIDGNSKDNTNDIINNYSSKIDKHICEEDSGIYSAMNKGLLYAKGEYILFLNAGDYFYDDSILKKVNDYNTKEEILYGFLKLETKKILKNLCDTDIKKYLRNNTLPHQATFVKKSLYEKTGGFDTSFRIAGDYDFFVKSILILKATYKYLPVLVSTFDLNGISSKNPGLMDKEKKIVQEKYYSLLYANAQNTHVSANAPIHSTIINIQNYQNITKYDFHQWLKKHLSSTYFVSLTNYLEQHRNRGDLQKITSLTFEYKQPGDLKQIIPLLAENNVPATIFISSCLLVNNLQNFTYLLYRYLLTNPSFYLHINNQKVNIQISDANRNAIFKDLNSHFKEQPLKDQLKFLHLIGAINSEQLSNTKHFQTKENLKSILTTPLFSIGSMGVSNVPLVLLDPIERMRELRDSKTQIENELNCKAYMFSPPHDQFDDDLIMASRACGYQAILADSKDNKNYADDDFIWTVKKIKV